MFFGYHRIEKWRSWCSILLIKYIVCTLIIPNVGWNHFTVSIHPTNKYPLDTTTFRPSPDWWGFDFGYLAIDTQFISFCFAVVEIPYKRHSFVSHFIIFRSCLINKPTKSQQANLLKMFTRLEKL